MAITFVMLPPQREATLRWASRLRDEVSGATVLTPGDEAEAARLLRDADAAFGALPPQLLHEAHRLRWLQAPAAGPEPGFYHQGLVDHPMVVTNLRGTHRDIVSVHAVMLLLALCRALPRYIAQQHRREWQLRSGDGMYLHLQGATVLIVGAGEIGDAIGELLHPFGCRVIATDARRTLPSAGIPEVFGVERLPELLPNADAVVITVPHTPSTENLFDEAMLARMKPGALLVNVGRGAVVDIDALADALQTGRLGGAGIDVVPVEPLHADHPLWDAPNLIITPHSAAAGVDVDERIYQTLRENLRRFIAGEALLNVVDKAQGF